MVSARLVLAPIEVILTKLFNVISNTFKKIFFYVYRKKLGNALTSSISQPLEIKLVVDNYYLFVI